MSLKGRKFTEEHKKAISLAHKGMKKIWTSEFMKGRKLSQETKDKMSKSKTGSNHPNWQGGKTDELRKARNSKEIKEWRKLVFERDNYTCQYCGVRGCKLEAHHIKDFANNIELRYELNNGITLCEYCHKLTDNYKAKNKTHFNNQNTKNLKENNLI